MFTAPLNHFAAADLVGKRISLDGVFITVKHIEPNSNLNNYTRIDSDDLYDGSAFVPADRVINVHE